MCSPSLYQAAAIAASGVGNLMQSRAQHQTQMGRSRAELEALRRTNERQRLLRALERRRQTGMNEAQQEAFQRSIGSATPEEIQGRQSDAQMRREDLMDRVMERSRADVPLPGSTIPGGGGGVMPQANRVVADNLAEDAERVGSARAALAAFPDAMGRISEALIPGEFNIGRLNQTSSRSRNLLPNELDAARYAPRYPAPEGALFAQLLQGLGRAGSMYAGMQRGAEAQQSRQVGQNLVDEFGNGPLIPPNFRYTGPGA